MRAPALDLAAVKHDLPPVTPRSLGPDTARRRQARRLELLRTEEDFTANVQDSVARILQGALVTGATHAVVQTVRVDRQYTYQFVETKNDADAHVIRDLYSLAPIEGVKARIRFCSSAIRLVEWLRVQGLEVYVCSRRVQDRPFKGQVPVADWMQIVAVFVPHREECPGTIAALFNTQYVDTVMGAGAAKQWTERLARALSKGATYYCNAVLYVGRDFGQGSAGTPVAEPLHHPTMAPLQVEWALADRLAPMVMWITQMGYSWTLCAPSAASKWAFFIVLLDPVDTYK